MTQQRARDLLAEAIGQVAPEVDLASIDPAAALRDAADLDSMDFLTLVGLLAEALGADIPEDDYPRLDTLSDAIDYLQGKLA